MNMLSIIYAICGGILGSSFGAIPVFIIMGFSGLSGIAFGAIGLNMDWFGLVPFGLFLGPHISFVGGVAAAAYASKRRYIESGRDILKPLIVLKKPDVLLVGGAFGCAGYFINFLLGKLLAGKIDTIALTVCISAFLTKMVFDSRNIFGKTTDEVIKSGGRYSERSPAVWIPWMSTSIEKTILGVAFGVFSSAMTYSFLQNSSTAPIAVYFGFCISALSLIFLQFGAPIPVSHHITLCASLGVIASGGSIWWGVASSVAAAFTADFLARTFLVFSDTHIDPPAMGITVISLLLLGILPTLNTYEIQTPIIPVIIITLTFAYSIFQHVLNSKNKKV